MLNFRELNEKIPPLDESTARRAQERWDSVAKPLGSLGQLEQLVVKIAALTGEPDVELSKRAVVVCCADNGVAAEGVVQTDQSVTAAMAAQIRDKRSCVCVMAAAAGAETRAVDMGMLSRVTGVDGPHIADGTGNIAAGPAMTREQACQAIEYGVSLVKEYREKGYRLLATGEMGIGNTTTSSALAAVLLGLPVDTVTGRGAGLSDEGLERKRAAIRQAIAVNRPAPDDPLDALAKLGGFDIAGMAGLFLGGALYRVPILVDGLISAPAALIAARLCPNSTRAMIASHVSAEPAAVKILQELGLGAVLRADLRLGEGTGAVCMMPLLDLALAAYHGAAAFSDVGIGQYEKLGGERP